MPTCNRCEDPTNYEWYQDHMERWHLGTKLDVNSYRSHICITQEKTGNKRNWVKFSCIRCGSMTKQNMKLNKSKTINLCYECDDQ